MEELKLKKIVGLLTAVTLLNTVSFAEFNDIDKNHWGYEAVEKMSAVQVLSGYPDGSFKPSKNITLAEYASIFSNFFNISENKIDNYFVDIEKGHWAKGKIEAIREYIQPKYDSLAESLKDYTKATEYGIKQDLPITREIVIYSLNSILALDNNSYSVDEAKKIFADYDKIIYPEAAFVLYKNNIISGEIIDGKVYIHPDRYITRVEISSMFSKLLNEGNKISNTETVEDFSNLISQMITLIKENKLNEVKDYIYDSGNKLCDIDFNIMLTKDIKVMVKKYFDKLEYNISEVSFDSYNKAHVLINKSSYDYISVLEPLKNIKISDLTTSKLTSIANDMEKQYKKTKNKIVNVIETINFIKTNDGWKIVL